MENAKLYKHSVMNVIVEMANELATMLEEC